MYSFINAEYLIESRLKGSKDSVYIFLKRREEKPEYYCIVSFFKKDTVTYGGDKLYWMLKEKQYGNKKMILYRHPNYKQSQ